MRKLTILSAIILGLSNTIVPVTLADHAERAEFFDEITIVGNKDAANKITGSAHFLSDEQLEVFEFSDIQRILREVPGVSIQVEDGYGLRPNIGIRGVPTERSARVVLLEDNVPIAPAPYAASSAYYFPTMGRMYNVEVVKGPSAITQGPNTIGGAINFVSTPIPRQAEGKINIEVGEDSTTRTHVSYGNNHDNGFGFLLETHQWKSDGYQSIDRSNNDTGLDVEDYTIKLAYAPDDSRHAVELKYQYAQQDSNQSYLGLTDADFNQDPYRRYGVSQLDNISTEHNQVILRYEFAINEAATFSATAYNNTHKRSWFKTEGIDSEKWFAVVQAVNEGVDLSPTLTSAVLQSVLDGGDTPAGITIKLRDNAREYYSRGVQFKLDWQIEGESIAHDIELGARYHQDQEDRLQQDFFYTQQNGSLVFDSANALGAAGNRVQDADAFSMYIHDTITMGDLSLTPGLRYEKIDLMRSNYTGGAARVLSSERENTVEVLLPGLGALYAMSDSLSVLVGAYKGFGSPTNKAGVDEEKSINYEFGTRYQNDELYIELIGFLNDYDNLLGVCSASSGSNCTPGDAFNGGKATVQGVEFLIKNQFNLAKGLAIPASIAYTYTDSEFDSSFTSDFDGFGTVVKGDPIPYIAENQLTLSLGVEQGDFALNAVVTYADEVCVLPSCGQFEKTESSTTLDLVTRYQLNQDLGVYAKLENVTSEEKIVGRHPYGARPNKDRTATVGIKVNF